MCFVPQTACTFSTSQLPRVVRTCSVFSFFTCKCASCHKRPALFRALFRHLNFQEWSEREVFLAFSLAHVLRVTTACTFASLIWPDGSAPAALASLRSHKSLEKHSVSRLSYLFAHLSFFLLTLSLLIFSLLVFSSL